MPLEQTGDCIRLTGHCSVEEAEPLLDALRATPGAVVDLPGAAWLHPAVLQVLMAAAPALRGRPAGPVPEACLAGLPEAGPEAG